MNVLKKMCLNGTAAFLCLVLSSYNPQKNYVISSSAISIESALKYDLISYEIVNNGSHKGECVTINLQNKTSRALNVTIEPGRNLVSVDTNKQDILIVKEALFALTPMESSTKNLFGFCSQAHKSSPSEGEKYLVGEMKDANIIKLAEHLNKNKYPISAMQYAVWTLTNNRPVASIFHENRDSIIGLQEFLSYKQNKVTPWYSIEYMPNDSTGMVSNKAKNIYGTLKADLEKGRVIKVVVYDLYNISQIRKDIKVPEKTKEQSIVVDVSELPKGRYRMLFTSLAGRIDEKIFWI
ncbi:MAG: hypothetical protein OQJ96_12415 [Flavobacteriales bacterium]|nr:hypothetical protein [Flavobacteriales bacterium]MCW8913891.1 hypothetical protein [Flavobacteriales bacterium]MCW8937259.1 hypothetical protein [Flavobacteriales bacterium]MCW8939420.1 hypothetical protein [Flavobacteriales bacterium]MCW8967225.1 hypothetical protein [Flavobacteriales bacterium]